MDRVNQKYGKDTLSIASIHDIEGAGTAKIAFNRIPDQDEV